MYRSTYRDRRPREPDLVGAAHVGDLERDVAHAERIGREWSAARRGSSKDGDAVRPMSTETTTRPHVARVKPSAMARTHRTAVAPNVSLAVWPASLAARS
jgi:hypothetical protein